MYESLTGSLQISFKIVTWPDLNAGFEYIKYGKGFVPISAYDYNKNPVISTMQWTMQSVKSFTQW